jgi:hypothetical protein
MRMNIQKRHIDLDTRCAICNAMFESGGHLFVASQEVSKVWTALSLDQTRQGLLQCDSAMELMDQVLAMPYDEKMKCVALLWCWWTEKNKANRGERRLSLDKLQATIISYMQEWKLHPKKDPK